MEFAKVAQRDDSIHLEDDQTMEILSRHLEQELQSSVIVYTIVDGIHNQ